MKINNIVIYAKVDGKICLVRNKCPNKILLNTISGFSDGKIELIPMTDDFRLQKLSSGDIDQKYINEENDA